MKDFLIKYKVFAAPLLLIIIIGILGMRYKFRMDYIEKECLALRLHQPSVDQNKPDNGALRSILLPYKVDEIEMCMTRNGINTTHPLNPLDVLHLLFTNKPVE